jgi:YfiH family protein
VKVLPFHSASKIPGLHAFTTLRGANLGLNTDEDPQAVLGARQKLWQSQGLKLEDTIFLKQVHSDHLETVGKAEAGRGSKSLADALPDCDAVISRDRGVYLAIGHADCLAVLLADPRQGIVGAAHSGWRGASLRIAGKLATKMIADFGSRPSELWAGLSVCLGPCHLELSQEQHALFAAQPHSADFCGPLNGGHFMLDLWEQSRSQLLDLGLDPAKIEVQKQCTACHLDQFYSYRAEKGHCGRMMSVVGFG